MLIFHFIRKHEKNGEVKVMHVTSHDQLCLKTFEGEDWNEGYKYLSLMEEFIKH